MKKVMMTVFKIVLILIAVVVVGVVALILFALHKESNYYKYTEAVGEIEQKYTAFGDKEVSCQEYAKTPVQGRTSSHGARLRIFSMLF